MKCAITTAGLLALIYSVVLAYFFFTKWTRAKFLNKNDGPRGSETNEYHCFIESGIIGNQSYQEDYAPVWINWMHATFICYIILSVMALITIFGAFVKNWLSINGEFCICCGWYYAVVCTIGLTIVRFGEKGRFCVDKAGSTDVRYIGDVSEQLATDG